MHNFYSAADVGNVNAFVDEAIQLKQQGNDLQHIGKGKTILLLFFNPSLRTRLSTQRAAINLGMDVICMNAAEAWKWEMEDGSLMKFDKAEHIKDAAKVISQYVDMVAIRSFPSLKDRDKDYQDELIQTFIKYADIPVVNMESSILHPLQSLADMMTIKEHQKQPKSKIVVSWAPHPKALPQAVANSFLEWIQHTNHEVVITHPKGLELHNRFTKNAVIEYDQKTAFENADFVYTKNWSSFADYGKPFTESQDWIINAEKMALTNTNHFMHCLPIRRNVVATDQALDHTSSLIIPQAKNRLHAAEAVLHKLLTS